LQIGVRAGEPSCGCYSLIVRGVNPTCFRIDKCGKRVHISRFEFSQTPVGQNFRGQLMTFGKLGQDINIGREPILCFLAFAEVELFKKNCLQLFGGIDVECLSGQTKYLSLRDGQKIT